MRPAGTARRRSYWTASTRTRRLRRSTEPLAAGVFAVQPRELFVRVTGPRGSHCVRLRPEPARQGDLALAEVEHGVDVLSELHPALPLAGADVSRPHHHVALADELPRRRLVVVPRLEPAVQHLEYAVTSVCRLGQIGHTRQRDPDHVLVEALDEGGHVTPVEGIHRPRSDIEVVARPHVPTLTWSVRTFVWGRVG